MAPQRDHVGVVVPGVAHDERPRERVDRDAVGRRPDADLALVAQRPVAVPVGDGDLADRVAARVGDIGRVVERTQAMLAGWLPLGSETVASRLPLPPLDGSEMRSTELLWMMPTRYTSSATCTIPAGNPPLGNAYDEVTA